MTGRDGRFILNSHAGQAGSPVGGTIVSGLSAPVVDDDAAGISVANFTGSRWGR